MEGNLTLDSVQIDSHGVISGRVQDGDSDGVVYRQLLEEMMEHFSNEQNSTLTPYHPHEGQICAGKLCGRWFRVRVLVTLSRKSGHEASCMFVDEGRHEMIPVYSLRCLPAKFQRLPHQIRILKLHDVVPRSVRWSSEDLSVAPWVSKEWDMAAVKYMEDFIKDAEAFKCNIEETLPDSSLSVRLYIERPSGGYLCLNEMLVQGLYAFTMQQATENQNAVSKRSNKTLEEVQRSNNLFASLNVGKPNVRDVGVKSDTEFTTHTAVGGRGRTEHGYLTDGQGVTTVSHRAIHASSGPKRREGYPASRGEYPDRMVRQVDSGGNRVFSENSDSPDVDPLGQGDTLVWKKRCNQNESNNRYTRSNVSTDGNAYPNMSPSHSSRSLRDNQSGDSEQFSDDTTGIRVYGRGKGHLQELNVGDSRVGSVRSTSQKEISDRYSVSTQNAIMGNVGVTGSSGHGRGRTVGNQSIPKIGESAISDTFSQRDNHSSVDNAPSMQHSKRFSLTNFLQNRPVDHTLSDSPSECESMPALEMNTPASPLSHGSPRSAGRGVNSPISPLSRSLMESSPRSAGRGVNSPISPLSRSLMESSPRSAGRGAVIGGRGMLLTSPVSRGNLSLKENRIVLMSEPEIGSNKSSIRNLSLGSSMNNSNAADSRSDTDLKPRVRMSNDKLSAVSLQFSANDQQFYNPRSDHMGAVGRGRSELRSESECSGSEVNICASLLGQRVLRKTQPPKLLDRTATHMAGASSTGDEAAGTGSVNMMAAASSRPVEKTTPHNDRISADHASRNDRQPVQRSSLHSSSTMATRSPLSTDITMSRSSVKPPLSSDTDCVHSDHEKILSLLRSSKSETDDNGRRVGSEKGLVAGLARGRKLRDLMEVERTKTGPSGGQRLERDPGSIRVTEGARATEGATGRSGQSSAVDNSTGKEDFMKKFKNKNLMDTAANESCKGSLKAPRKGRGEDMSGLKDNVVVHGKSLCHPCRRIEDAHFMDHIVEDWREKEDVASPSIAQSYTWPNINRGQHVITVSPSRTGKTLAYLYPLLSALSECQLYRESSHQGMGVSKIYRSVIHGMGPLMLILTLSWQRAKAVYYKARRILRGRDWIRVSQVHGGGEEDNKACTLINGCEVLVVTPPCLTRLRKQGYVELNRLCHLVVDDADQVLDSFMDDIRELGTAYSRVLKNEQKHREAPKQMLLVASHWNDRLHSFMRSLIDPVLIITSLFEAAIYGRVKQVTHMCKSACRMNEVLSMMAGLDRSSKTIIFASKKQDILKLQQVLKSSSYYCMIVHQDMELYDAQAVAEEWRNRLPLLVCCDEYIMEMHIYDATTVIHYDLPESKTRFGNRLSCMRQYFYNFVKPAAQTIEPVSHLIISEGCVKQVRSIKEMLDRTNTVVSPELKAFLGGIMEEREQDKERQLCTKKLAYGFCREKVLRCQARHTIIPEIDCPADSNWMPDEGEIKIVVTRVMDANHYYVRLLSLRGEDGVTDLTPAYSKLQMDLALWYSNLTHQKRHPALFPGEVCGYQDKESFYRIQVVDMSAMNNSDNSASTIEAWVKYVDTGKERNVPAHRLYELPEHLKEVPFQAVEVFLCRVKPVDKDPDWTTKADCHVAELLSEKTLEGKVVLRIGHILFLDPLVERVQLGEARTIVNRTYVHMDLIRNGLANENPNHLPNLYRLCVNKVKVSKALTIKSRMSLDLITDVLPACRLYHDVYVSSVTRPDLFFVQRKDKHDELEEMMTEIGEYISQLDDDEEMIPELSVGNYCLAEYSGLDNRWYRGQVLKVEDAGYMMFFADYGDSDEVPRNKVRALPHDQFFELPLQAIECQLASVRPTGRKWEDPAGDMLWDLSHYVNNDYKMLVAQVKKPVKAEFAGCSKFSIELFNTLDSNDVRFGEEMVWSHLALAEHSSDVKPLFERPLGVRRMMYPSLLHKIPNLCALLYWEQDPTIAKDVAKEIISIIEISTPSISAANESVAVLGVRALMKLVGRVQIADIHGLVLSGLHIAAKNSNRLCEELLDTFIVPLLRCLEMNSNPVFQCQAAECVAKLSSVSDKAKFQDQTQLQVLYELFDYSQNEQVQGSVCYAFTSLCSGSEYIYQYLMAQSICPKIVKLLSASDDHHVTEGVVLLLSQLAEHDGEGERSHGDLKRESLIEAIVRNLSDSDCDKCIQHSIQLCDNFAATRRKHKTFLLENGMVQVLTRILELELQSTTRQLSKDLLSSLVVRVPSEPMEGVSIGPMTSNLAYSTGSTVAPEVRWAQNSFRVMLNVKVNDTRDAKDLVTLTSSVVSFNAILDCVHYAFNYTLFDKIIPEKSTFDVRTQEVLISLRKKTEGRWPRLLLQKQKPGNLVVDYERFVDSSSDSEVCDDDRPFILKKSKHTKKLPATRNVECTVKGLPAKSDTETDTDDSLVNMGDPDDRDRFNFLLS